MRFLATAIALCATFSLHAQLTLYGIVRDSSTYEAIPFANILVKGTTRGTQADATGNFSVKVDQLPATLVVRAIGYTTKEVEISKISSVIQVKLIPLSQTLGEVVISSSPLKCVQEDKSLMASCFEFYDNFVLLLAHRDFRSPSRLILLDENGKTVSTLYISSKADTLYRDCFGRVHLFTKDSCWQVYYDYEKIQLLYPSTRNEIESTLYPYRIYHAGRLYSQFTSYRRLRMKYYVSANGMTTNFHYACDTATITYLNTKYDLNYFLEQRRRQIGYGYPLEYINSHMDQFRDSITFDEQDKKFVKRLNAPLQFHDNAIWIFQYTDDIAIRFNANLLPSDTVRITFHKRRGWQGSLIRDEITGDLYTSYEKGGLVTIAWLHPTTLDIIKETPLEGIPFCGNLRVRNGMLWLLWWDRTDGNANRMLYRYRL